MKFRIIILINFVKMFYNIDSLLKMLHINSNYIWQMRMEE